MQIGYKLMSYITTTRYLKFDCKDIYLQWKSSYYFYRHRRVVLQSYHPSVNSELVDRLHGKYSGNSHDLKPIPDRKTNI